METRFSRKKFFLPGSWHILHARRQKSYDFSPTESVFWLGDLSNLLRVLHNRRICGMQKTLSSIAPVELCEIEKIIAAKTCLDRESDAHDRAFALDFLG